MVGAIASIMSRNGSHNIGSHVLSALSHKVEVMPDDRIFYKYIQHRMDYIATITTEFPVWSQPTAFVGDLMRNFFMQRHLLQYIADSEGLNAYHFQDPNMDESERKKQENTIKLHVRRIKKDIKNAPNNNHLTEWKDADDAKNNTLHFIDYINYKEDERINFEHDVQVAIPGGVIGRHAFYTILENIIRNSAKHGWSKKKDKNDKEKNLEIYIDLLSNDENDFVEFTVWDNMSNVFKGTNITSEAEAEYLKEISIENIKKLEKKLKEEKKKLPLHYQQCLMLSKPFIDDKGELRKENWGLAEMRISAGYLNKNEVGEIGALISPKDPIITPVTMPATCSKNFPIDKNHIK